MRKLFISMGLKFFIGSGLGWASGQEDAYEKVATLPSLSPKEDPFQPYCEGKKISGLNISRLNTSDQMDSGTCYAHAPTTNLEAAHFRRSGENQKFSVDYGVCLSKDTLDSSNIADATRNALKGRKAMSGGNPEYVLRKVLENGSIPKEHTYSGKALTKFLSHYNLEAEKNASLVTIEFEKIKLGEEYQKLKLRVEKLKTRMANMKIDEEKRSRAEKELGLSKAYADRIDPDGKPLLGLEYNKRWLEIQEAWKNREENQKFYNDFAKAHPDMNRYFRENIDLSTKLIRATENLSAFEEKNREDLVAKQAQTFCVGGKCLSDVVAELKTTHAKDFVDIKDYARFFIKDELFGGDSLACDNQKLFQTLNHLLCLGIPLQAESLPFGPYSQVKSLSGNPIMNQNVGYHSALLSGIRRDSNGVYEMIFHNNWGPDKDLVVPAGSLCSLGDFEAVVDKKPHSGEDISEANFVSGLLALQGVGLKMSSKIMSKTREGFRKIVPFEPFKGTPVTPQPQAPYGSGHYGY